MELLLATRPQGGPSFSLNRSTYEVRNAGVSGSGSLIWEVEAQDVPDWLTVTPTGGTLAPGQPTTVTVSINESVANTLPVGRYEAGIAFRNTTPDYPGVGDTTVPATLRVTDSQRAFVGCAVAVTITGRSTARSPPPPAS